MHEQVKLKRSRRRAAVLFISGEGGHLEQARRLVSHIESDIKSEANCILLTDHVRDSVAGFDSVLSVPTCAPKHREVKWQDVYAYTVAAVKVIFYLLRNYRVKSVIVTGPGFALLPSLAFRLSGAKLIVFESWSRFEDKSKCSKALYSFANVFVVQHKDLLKLYPKAIWVGLL